MRNAVKKRMQKRFEKRKEERMEKKAEEGVLGLVGTEFKTKYPKGSYIMFTSSHNKGEQPESVSCSWYDKVGGPNPLKHIVSRPPEWQNISMEEADKIVELFDEYLYMPLVYV